MKNIRNLLIAPASLGKLLLVDVRPAYEYKDNKRTDTVLGYRYEVAMPKHALEKLSVQIEGEQLMQTPSEGFVEVEFTDLEIGMYLKDNELHLSAKATGVMPAGKKHA